MLPDVNIDQMMKGKNRVPALHIQQQQQQQQQQQSLIPLGEVI